MRFVGLRLWRVLSLIICITLPVARPAPGGETAQGVVFRDCNGNAVRDFGERGIPRVCVSNGREVIETDSRGVYQLPVEDDTVIFVIKPRGWMTPADVNNLPRFFYIHKPVGTPASKFKGVDPTGPLPKSVDFPLHRNRERKRFRTVFFGDTQARNQKEVDYIARDVVEELVGVDAAFGVTLGDIVFDDLAVFEPLNATIGQIGVPWYNVQGNHDTNQDSPNDRYADETFERIYGPSYYAFNHGKVHFINLDSVAWEGKGYHGELGEKQLEFIRNDLNFVPKDRLVVLMMHIPVMEFRDRDALFALMYDRPRTFSISAHRHTQRHFFLAEGDGWQGDEPHHHLVNVTVCGGWWSGATDENGIPHATMSDGAPNGYSMITFDGNDYSIEFKAARRPADYQMHIHAPETVQPQDAAGVEVMVNVFGGSEWSEVEMRLGDSGPWTPMTRIEREDPYYVRLKQLEALLPDEAGPKLPKASACSHIWSAHLPANPPNGTHLIHVRTTDMFGQTYASQRIVRIE